MSGLELFAFSAFMADGGASLGFAVRDDDLLGQVLFVGMAVIAFALARWAFTEERA